jgi:hypothetical protein
MTVMTRQYRWSPCCAARRSCDRVVGPVGSFKSSDADAAATGQGGERSWPKLRASRLVSRRVQISRVEEIVIHRQIATMVFVWYNCGV